MRVEIINPFNEEDMDKIKNYDIKNNTELEKTITSQYASMDEKTYKRSIIESYIVGIYCYKEKNNAIDEICYINMEKDINKATILPINNTKKTSSIISQGVNFVFETTDITDITVIVNDNDKKVKKELDEKGFISLGEESKNQIYYIEKDFVYNYSREKLAI